MSRYFTLIFTFPKKPYLSSKIIRSRLNTEYSHVAGIVSTGPIGVFDVYQASHGDVHALNLENFLEKNNVIKSVRIEFKDSERYYRLIRYLKKQRGKDYNEWAAIAATLPGLRSLGIGKDGDTSFICSEYTARALEVTGDFNYGAHRDAADYVDPHLFERLLRLKGYEFYSGLHLPEFRDEPI